MSRYRIPFNRPTRLEASLQAVSRAVSGGHISAGGPFTKECEALLRGKLRRETLLTTSCTHALEMSALLLDVKPGDEVIVPSFTFVSTANAFALFGARIRFVDCDECGNLELAHVERLLSPKARAVVAVHYGGNSCDMERLVALCEERGAVLVEDAAQSLGASWNGRPLGTFGALGCISFHETKNVCAGEGGALVAGDSTLAARAAHLRDKGTNRREFQLGQAEKYTWVDVGSSWGLSDLNAAYLLPQLEAFSGISARRRVLWERYRDALGGPIRAAGGRTLEIPPGNDPNHHLFALIWPSRQRRDAFIAHMEERGILTPFHYVALHGSPFGKKFADPSERFPGTEALSSGLVRLPLFYNLSDGEQAQVIGAVKEFCG